MVFAADEIPPLYLPFNTKSLSTLEWLNTILTLALSLFGVALALVSIFFAAHRYRRSLPLYRYVLVYCSFLLAIHIGTLIVLSAGKVAGFEPVPKEGCVAIFGFLNNVSLVAPNLIAICIILTLANVWTSLFQRHLIVPYAVSIVAVLIGLIFGTFDAVVFVESGQFERGCSDPTRCSAELPPPYAGQSQIFHSCQFAAFYLLPLILSLVALRFQSVRYHDSSSANSVVDNPRSILFIPTVFLLLTLYIFGMALYANELRAAFVPGPADEILSVGLFFLDFPFLILGWCVLYPLAIYWLILRASSIEDIDIVI